MKDTTELVKTLKRMLPEIDVEQCQYKPDLKFLKSGIRHDFPIEYIENLTQDGLSRFCEDLKTKFE